MEAFSPTKRQPVIFSGQPGRSRWFWTTGRRASPSTAPRPAPALVPTVLPFPSTMEAKDVLKWTETLKVHPINKKEYVSQPKNENDPTQNMKMGPPKYEDDSTQKINTTSHNK